MKPNSAQARDDGNGRNALHEMSSVSPKLQRCDAKKGQESRSLPLYILCLSKEKYTQMQISNAQKDVIANQSADWCGNPFFCNTARQGYLWICVHNPTDCVPTSMDSPPGCYEVTFVK